MKVHIRIRTLRRLQDLSYDQMSQWLNVSKSAYGKIERGETRLDYERICQLAVILNVDVLLLTAAENFDLLIQQNEQGEVTVTRMPAQPNHMDLTARHEEEKAALLQVIASQHNFIAQQKELIDSLMKVRRRKR